MSSPLTTKRLKIKTAQVPVVEIDPQAGAVYIRFNRHKVARTDVRQEWPHIAVDFSKSNEVIGIEAIGMDEFTITTILKKADIDFSKPLAQRARYVPVKSSKVLLA